MIGNVIMEIEPDEMRAAVEFYLNHTVFHVEGYPSREGQRAHVSVVRQRSNGNFVIEFHGWFLPKEQPDTGTNDIS
jgi:hypothetical protein